MLIEAEIITNCNHWTITDYLAIRSEIDLHACTEIQVLLGLLFIKIIHH